MVNSHVIVTSQSQKYRNSLKRAYFVTPKNFIDYLLVFRNQLRSGLGKTNAAIKRLDSGLHKLNEAADTVDTMQVELSEKKVLNYRNVFIIYSVF